MNSDSARINTANFLINAAALLPSHHRTHKLLKSYYLTKSYKLSKSNIQQNQSFFSNENCCQKCLSHFDGSNFSMMISPIKFTKRKSQRIREKIEKDAKKGPKMKLMSRKINNIVKFTCELCGNQSRITLWKKNQANNAEIEKKQASENISEQSESKAMEIPKVRKSNLIAIGPMTKVTKPKDQVRKKIASGSDAKKNVNDPQKMEKSNKNHHKNKTLLLSNANKNSAKKGAPSTSAMKKNSLLQLAAALKTKTKISDSNCRLKQMFNSK